MYFDVILMYFIDFFAVFRNLHNKTLQKTIQNLLIAIVGFNNQKK